MEINKTKRLIIEDTDIIDFFETNEFIDINSFIITAIKNYKDGGSPKPITISPESEALFRDYKVFMRQKHTLEHLVRDFQSILSRVKFTELDDYFYGKREGEENEKKKKNKKKRKTKSVPESDSENNSESEPESEPESGSIRYFKTPIKLILCDHCKNYKAPSKKSLALHKRGCLKKIFTNTTENNDVEQESVEKNNEVEQESVENNDVEQESVENNQY